MLKNRRLQLVNVSDRLGAAARGYRGVLTSSLEGSPIETFMYFNWVDCFALLAYVTASRGNKQFRNKKFSLSTWQALMRWMINFSLSKGVDMRYSSESLAELGVPCH